MPDPSSGDWKARVRERLAGLDLDPATEAETIDELTQHVEDRYRDLVASGTAPAAAEARAWRELEGHPKLAREISRARAFMPLEPVQDQSRFGLWGWWEDGKYAWRRLRYAPGFACVVLVTVMLTVGANTAILSVADAVLFRPLPYDHAQDIAIIQMRDPKTGRQFTMTSYSYLQAINDGCPSVSEVALLEPFDGLGTPPVRPMIDTADGQLSLRAVEVTPNYFGILGVKAARGRLLNASDAGREGVAAVLSHAAWQQRFGSDESIVGKSLTLGAARIDVVGVLPPGFVFPSIFAGQPALVVLRKPLSGTEKGGSLHAIVRVAPGVSLERAQGEVDSAVAATTSSAEIAATTPALNDVRSMLYPIGRPIMRFLLAAAGFILLLGCSNLANILLVRGRRGLHDTAIRIALGASRSRLIRPVVIEAVLLGVGGAVLALVLTSLLFEALLRQVPAAAYGSAAVGVDVRVIVAAIAMGLLCALSFSIVPAWRASGVQVLGLIQRRGGRGGRIRLGRPLIVVQVAIAVAVVFGAVVATRAFVSVLSVPLGFSSDRVVTVNLGFPSGVTAADRAAAFARVIEKLGARPDIEAVGAAGAMPMSGSAPNDGVRAGERGPMITGLAYALPGYFEAIDLKALRGRTWTRDDSRFDPDAAIVSESAARALFGDRDPIGATFYNGRDRTFHVVGLVADVRNSIDRDSPPQAYIMPPQGRGPLTVVVRARNRSAAVLNAIKADVRAVGPSGVPAVEWWEDAIAGRQVYQNPRFQTLVLTGLATLALGLTALGIFSVVAYVVTARTREMGVRLAIGASPSSLVRLIVQQSLMPVGIGLAAGILLILWGKGLAEAQLFKIDTTDPLAIAGAAVTVLAGALLAAYLPARRATRINPTDVLRAE